MTIARTAIQDFSTANPIYANAIVTAYTVVGGSKSTIKASLYSSLSASTLLANPQTLDSYGKFKQPVYIAEPVVLSVTGLKNTPDHDTGIISLDHSFVDVVISSTEILALHTTPKTLVAAQGANKAIIMDRAVFFLDYNSAAYASVGASDDLTLRYTDGSGAILGTLETTGFLDQAADTRAIVTPVDGSVILPSNTPLVAFLGGQVTTGNSPVAARVFYHTIDLTGLVTA